MYLYPVLYIETHAGAPLLDREVHPPLHLEPSTAPTRGKPTAATNKSPECTLQPSPNHFLAPVQPLRSTLLSFLAVSIWFLVRWPRTGRPMACRLPRYVPMSRNRLMLS